MERAYNSNISERANRSLDRRYRKVKAQKRLIAILIFITISAAILLGSSIHAFASSKSESLNKYYTSIRVEKGDTVWSLADKYNMGTDVTKQDYVDEVCQLNSLNDGKLTAGQYIVVVYYSAEEK